MKISPLDQALASAARTRREICETAEGVLRAYRNIDTGDLTPSELETMRDDTRWARNVLASFSPAAMKIVEEHGDESPEQLVKRLTDAGVFRSIEN